MSNFLTSHHSFGWRRKHSSTRRGGSLGFLVAFRGISFYSWYPAVPLKIRVSFYILRFFARQRSFKIGMNDSLDSYVDYFCLTCSFPGLWPENFPVSKSDWILTLHVPYFHSLSKLLCILNYGWGIGHIQPHVVSDSSIDSRINISFRNQR